MTTGSACCLSRKWKRDRLSGRWRRCRSTPPSSASSPSLTRPTPDHPPRPQALRPPANSRSPSIADPDTGNHVTSGYESETSPTSSTTTTTNSRGDDDRRPSGSSPQLDQPGGRSWQSDRSALLEQRRRRTSPDSGHSEDLAASSSGGPGSPRSVYRPRPVVLRECPSAQWTEVVALGSIRLSACLYGRIILKRLNLQAPNLVHFMTFRNRSVDVTLGPKNQRLRLHGQKMDGRHKAAKSHVLFRRCAVILKWVVFDL